MLGTSASARLRKKEAFTLHHPIPNLVPQNLAISILQDHGEIITLNPLVISHYQIPPPQSAPSNEIYNSIWYSITERIQYVPGLGRMGSGKISFQGCFRDTTIGLWTHIYAPMGVDLKVDYRVEDTKAGGKYGMGVMLSADIEIECNITLSSFVKSQLKDTLKEMVERMIKRASLMDADAVKEICQQQVEYTRSHSWELGQGQPQGQSQSQIQSQSKNQEQTQTRDQRHTERSGPPQSRDRSRTRDQTGSGNHSRDRSPSQVPYQTTRTTNETAFQMPSPSDYTFQPQTTRHPSSTGTESISHEPRPIELPTHTTTIKRRKSNDSLTSIYSIYSKHSANNSNSVYTAQPIPTIQLPITSNTPSPSPRPSSSTTSTLNTSSTYTSYTSYTPYVQPAPPSSSNPTSSSSTPSQNPSIDIPPGLTPGRRSSTPQLYNYMAYPGTSRRPVSMGMMPNGSLDLRGMAAELPS